MKAALTVINQASTAPSDRFVVGLKVQSFNWRMRKARLAKGWTQAQLAEMVGVNLATIQRLEAFAKQGTVPWDVLDRMADCLETDISVLFPSWLKPKIIREVVNGEMPVQLTEQMASDGDLARDFIQQQLYERLRATLNTLTEREQKVLELRFGLADGQPHTLDEVGDVISATRSRVRQIEAKALRKMRHPQRADALKELMDS